MSAEPKRPRASGLVAVLVVTALTGCASAWRQPEWIEHPEARYPPSQYMVGVGDGEDVDAAKAKAMAELSGIFLSEVRQVIQNRDSLRISDGVVFEETDLDIDTRLITKTEFEGIETREKWCCRQGNHYALVALDRALTTRSLADRMGSFEADVRNRLEGVEATEAPLERARMLMGALEPARERDALLAQYRVVSGRPWTPRPKTSELERRRDQAVDGATFVVKATVIEEASGRERRNRDLESSMQEIVSDSQFKVGGGYETMKLACTLSLAEPIERGNPPWIEYTWSATCEIAANQPSARAILVAEESAAASGSSVAASKKKALFQSNKAMRNRVRAELKSYLAEGS